MTKVRLNKRKLSQSKSESKVQVKSPSLKTIVKTLNSRTWTWSDSILLCHPPTHPPQKLFSATRHPIELKSSQ